LKNFFLVLRGVGWPFWSVLGGFGGKCESGGENFEYFASESKKSLTTLGGVFLQVNLKKV